MKISAGARMGLAFALTTAVVSGVSTFVNGYAVQGTSSDAFVTVRNLAVAGLLGPIAVVVSFGGGRRTRTSSRDLGWLAVVGLVGGAVPFLLFFHGLQLAAAQHGATTASFLYRTLFLFATVFGVVLLREKFSRWTALAGGLLLGGSYLLLSLGAPVWTDGSLWVLAATVLWAGEYTLSKRLLARLPSSTVAIGRMGFGGLFLSAYLLATAQWGSVAGFGASTWLWVGLSAALLTAFVTCWYAALARLDVGVATAVLVLGYPVTWLLSVGVSGRGVSAVELLGAAAVVVGVAVAAGGASLLRPVRRPGGEPG